MAPSASFRCFFIARPPYAIDGILPREGTRGDRQGDGSPDSRKSTFRRQSCQPTCLKTHVRCGGRGHEDCARACMPLARLLIVFLIGVVRPAMAVAQASDAQLEA